MKEVTFNELMHEYTVKLDGVTTYYLQPRTVLKLMQQVREATIEECANIELDSYSSVETQRRLDKLPTDRITIKE